jgi:Na+-transporting NADH:ubiquinone oxidoreductase subunit F
VRLACQCKVKRDFQISIPETLLSVRQYRGRVAAIRDLTHDIKEVRIALEEPPEIEMTPGQFVQIEVPPYALTSQPVYRAYSVSGDVRRRGEVELEIRYVAKGICTTYVHQHMKQGETLSLNGPYGEFYLRDTQRDIVFIAGGSGMAPIKSILTEMAHTKNPRRATYFFGARGLRDLFLVEEMKALEKTLPNFTFVPALSAPEPGDHWTGETGLITEVLDRRFERLENHEAYLCGSPGMIDACIATLKKKGMPESQIYYDKFA